MREPIRLLCAGALLIGATAFIGCDDKKADTTVTPAAAPTTMDSAKQAADKTMEKAADSTKQATDKAADKTKDATDTAKDKATGALDSTKK